jgi:hypothetical protein
VKEVIEPVSADNTEVGDVFAGVMIHSVSVKLVDSAAANPTD